MRKPACLAFLSLFTLVSITTTGVPLADGAESRLTVSENGRFLTRADGTPFFYLGDTAWELFHRLNREEAELYLRNRAEKGYTVIQAVVIAEISGLTRGNAYDDTPFIAKDVARPREAYFAHVDWIVEKAASLGLYVGMLPTWGRWVGGNDEGKDYNDFFNAGNAEAYGKYLATRYQNKPIIWVLGGDRQPTKTRVVWDNMAAGIRGVVGDSQLITYHPRTDSSTELHNAPWLDFNMIQSGHSPESTNFGAIERDYQLTPIKPCMDGEPAYEYPPDAMPENRPVGAIQVRRNAYWAVFAGAHGHTYGTHPIWQMYDEGREPRWDVVTPWHRAMDLPGASQLPHLKRLMLSRPFLSRIPDQGIIASEVPQGLARLQATRDGSIGTNDGTYLMVYFSQSTVTTINTAVLAGDTLQGWWFNPRTGQSTAIEAFKNGGTRDIEPPTNASGEDWVLVLDDASKGYEVP